MGAAATVRYVGGAMLELNNSNSNPCPALVGGDHDHDISRIFHDDDDDETD